MNAILDLGAAAADYTVDALSTTLDSNLGGSFGGAVDIVVVKQASASLHLPCVSVVSLCSFGPKFT